MINDFVANAYGIASLEDKEDFISVYEPSEKSIDKVRLVFGVGTDLGVAILARPNEMTPY